MNIIKEIAEMTTTKEDNKIKLILLLEGIAEFEPTLKSNLIDLVEEGNKPNQLLTVRGVLNIISSLYPDTFQRINIRQRLRK